MVGGKPRSPPAPATGWGVPWGAPGPSPSTAFVGRAQGARACSWGWAWAPRARWEAPGTKPLGGGVPGGSRDCETAFFPSVRCEHGAQGEKSVQGREGRGRLRPGRPQRARAGRLWRPPPARPGGRKPAALPGLFLACREPVLQARRLGQPGPQPGQRAPEKLTPHSSPSRLVLAGETPSGALVSTGGNERPRAEAEAAKSTVSVERESAPDLGLKCPHLGFFPPRVGPGGVIKRKRRVISGGLPGRGAAWERCGLRGMGTAAWGRGGDS